MGSAKRGLEEEHENHERWLVTYADMVTLLMVLFIVMFAMSQVDEKKFSALKEGLAAGFGESAAAMDGSESILDEQSGVVSPIAPNKFVESLPEEQQQAAYDAIKAAEQAKGQQQYAEATSEAERLSEVRERLAEALEEQGLAGDVRTSIDERGLVISLVSKHVTFQADRADLSRRGIDVLDTLAPVLASLPDPIEIDGHTNQEPVKPRYFATDWDLSAARAITVLRHLSEVSDIPGERLSAAAFGHEKPLVDPSKPGSQDVNKRVDIVVLSALPDETRELLDDAARGLSEGTQRTTQKTTQKIGHQPEQKTDHETDHETAAAEASHETGAEQ